MEEESVIVFPRSISQSSQSETNRVQESLFRDFQNLHRLCLLKNKILTKVSNHIAEGTLPPDISWKVNTYKFPASCDQTRVANFQLSSIKLVQECQQNILRERLAILANDLEQHQSQLLRYSEPTFIKNEFVKKIPYLSKIPGQLKICTDDFFVRQSIFVSTKNSEKHAVKQTAATTLMSTDPDPVTSRLDILEKQITSLVTTFKTLQVKNGSGPSRERTPSRRSENTIGDNSNQFRQKGQRRRSPSAEQLRSLEKRPRHPNSNSSHANSATRDSGKSNPPPRQNAAKKKPSTASR
jgi:hypothetical protein